MGAGAAALAVLSVCAFALVASVVGDGGAVCAETKYPSLCDRCVESLSPPGIDGHDKLAVAGALVGCAKTQSGQMLLNSSAGEDGGCVNATRSLDSRLDEASRLSSAQNLELAVEATLVVTVKCVDKVKDPDQIANMGVLLAEGVRIYEASSTAPPLISISLLSFMFLFLF